MHDPLQTEHMTRLRIFVLYLMTLASVFRLRPLLDTFKSIKGGSREILPQFCCLVVIPCRSFNRSLKHLTSTSSELTDHYYQATMKEQLHECMVWPALLSTPKAKNMQKLFTRPNLQTEVKTRGKLQSAWLSQTTLMIRLRVSITTKILFLAFRENSPKRIKLKLVRIFLHLKLLSEINKYVCK